MELTIPAWLPLLLLALAVVALSWAAATGRRPRGLAIFAALLAGVTVLLVLLMAVGG